MNIFCADYSHFISQHASTLLIGPALFSRSLPIRSLVTSRLNLCVSGRNPGNKKVTVCLGTAPHTVYPVRGQQPPAVRKVLGKQLELVVVKLTGSPQEVFWGSTDLFWGILLSLDNDSKRLRTRQMVEGPKLSTSFQEHGKTPKWCVSTATLSCLFSLLSQVLKVLMQFGCSHWRK